MHEKLYFFYVWIALIECKNELKFLKHYKTYCCFPAKFLTVCEKKSVLGFYGEIIKMPLTLLTLSAFSNPEKILSKLEYIHSEK
jgi:hypothetical protein